MCTEYCDCVLAALHVRYCAMSLWHQVCPVLCIVYCVPGIRSVVYWVLGLSYIVLGHWVVGPYALDATSRATAHSCWRSNLWHSPCHLATHIVQHLQHAYLARIMPYAHNIGCRQHAQAGLMMLSHCIDRIYTGSIPRNT